MCRVNEERSGIQNGRKYIIYVQFEYSKKLVKERVSRALDMAFTLALFFNHVATEMKMYGVTPVSASLRDASRKPSLPCTLSRHGRATATFSPFSVCSLFALE